MSTLQSNPVSKLVVAAAMALVATGLAWLSADARAYGLTLRDLVPAALAQPRPSLLANCVAQGECVNNDGPCPNGLVDPDSYTQCCQTIEPNHCGLVSGRWKLCGNQWKKHCFRTVVTTSTCIAPDCI